MTDEEVKLNWYAIAESGASMTAIHNLREHYSEVIEELEKENEELKKDKEYLDNTNNEQTQVILQLNEQIEKMKCCGNCTYRDLDKYVFPCDCCKRWHGKKSYNDCWEFAK